MPITLINKLKRKQTFLLDSPAFAHEQRTMAVTVIEEARDGNRYPRRVQKKVPGAFTLLAGETRHGLPDQIVAVPGIKKAIDSGTVKFLKVNIEATTTTTKTTKRKRGR